MSNQRQIQKDFIELLHKVRETGVPCQENPDAFFPEDYGTWAGGSTNNERIAEREAKAYCSTCPIRVQCAQYAIEAKEPYGIWGGLTPKERLAV